MLYSRAQGQEANWRPVLSSEDHNTRTHEEGEWILRSNRGRRFRGDQGTDRSSDSRWQSCRSCQDTPANKTALAQVCVRIPVDGHWPYECTGPREYRSGPDGPACKPARWKAP